MHKSTQMEEMVYQHYGGGKEDEMRQAEYVAQQTGLHSSRRIYSKRQAQNDEAVLWTRYEYDITDGRNNVAATVHEKWLSRRRSL
jgi:hypothetical protein